MAALQLVVRHTFLDLVDPDDNDATKTSRSRCLTDSIAFTHSKSLLTIESTDTASVYSSSSSSDSSDCEADYSFMPMRSDAGEPIARAPASGIGAPQVQNLQQITFAKANSEPAQPQLRASAKLPPGNFRLQRPPGCWSGQSPQSDAPVVELDKEMRTTVMLRPLPVNYTRDLLVELLERLGFAGQFDFVYLPSDFNTGRTLQYAFVNMTSPVHVRRLWTMFEGFVNWQVHSDEVCAVSWSSPHQGLSVHVRRYRDSPVMHPTVPECWRPALFANGVKVKFPAPTKKIKAPKLKHRLS